MSYTLHWTRPDGVKAVFPATAYRCVGPDGSPTRATKPEKVAGIEFDPVERDVQVEGFSGRIATGAVEVRGESGTVETITIGAEMSPGIAW